MTGRGSLANPRYLVPSAHKTINAEAEVSELMQDEGYKKVAKHLVSVGDFNVNSTSVNAWKAVLGSMDGKTLAYFDPITSMLNTREGGIRISRYIVPNFEPAPNPTTINDKWLQKRWGGSREITDQQLTKLAESIVEEVKERGPFLSLAEFVNRRLEDNSATKNGLKGALQEAIDKTSINDSFKTTSEEITIADVAPLESKSPSDIGYRDLESATGLTGEGAPGYITQADILMPLAPYIKVRSDTFRIRAYGESKDMAGKVHATAYCEARVQRGINYISQDDPPETPTKELNNKNSIYGRRFYISAFKWLTVEEI